MKGKRILIVGMAKSGQAAAKRLLPMGAFVYLNDKRNIEQFNGQLDCFDDEHVKMCLGVEPEKLLNEVDMVVISPGVPIQSEFIKQAQLMGIEVIGEIELAFRIGCAPVAGITGTNGKTTTTALTGEIFKASGRQTHVVGNIGEPYIAIENEQPGDMVVAEISSFQLESISTFHAVAAAILNITPDHLNRHGTMEEYIRVKSRIFENQNIGDYAILNYNDPILRTLRINTLPKKMFFSSTERLDEGCFIDNGCIVLRVEGEQSVLLPVNDMGMPGRHNVENAMAAALIAYLCGVKKDIIADVLHKFKGVEHRLEYVTDISGVRFINDSKGTNPDASIKAVQAMSAPTVLIAGGSDKNSDFVPLIQNFGKNIKHLVLVGATAPKILEAAESCGYKNTTMVDSFGDAVKTAYCLSKAGENVLLSPACASFDMFSNYEERGKVFKELVWRLKQEKEESAKD